MAETADFKRRRKSIERILRHWQEWGCRAHDMGLFTITDGDGEEWHYYDVLEGLASLPPRQRQAVWYMCVEDKSERETARIMGFDNVEVSPVQSYKSGALSRLINYLDATPEEQKDAVERVKRYGKHPRKKRVKKTIVEDVA